MTSKKDDLAYLVGRLEQENSRAKEAADASVGAVHGRLATLYEQRIRQLGEHDSKSVDGSADSIDAKAAVADARSPQFAAEYALARSEAAEALGNATRSSEWRAAAQELTNRPKKSV
jgi:hypothetical protein